MILQLKDWKPDVHPTAWVADNATVVGRVSIGLNSSVWFGSLIRGDVHTITIGDETNIQDLSIIHVTQDVWPAVIGNRITIGHRVTLHGCTLKDDCFVGIGSTVMDGCELGEFSFLGAGSLLPPGKKIPPRMLALGNPARVIREITPEEEAMMLRIRTNYSRLKEDYRNGLKEF
jgi:carbonic anhydrase/acetyltransferase-like protein (isoleucine patch superfamily)